MRTEGVNTLVLEIDVGWCAEGFFKRIGTHKRRGAIRLVLLEHRLGDIDERMLLIELLHTALPWEDVGKVVNTKGLLRSRMDGRERLVRHVSLDVVPLLWQLTLVK